MTTEILSDTTLINCFEQLMKEQRLPFDLALGRCIITIWPGQPLRPQLSQAFTPLYPALVAERFEKS